MKGETCLIKLSGDCLERGMLEWVKELSRGYFVVVCVGGGTQINDAFKKAGFPITFGPLGRETKTLAEQQLARTVLEQNQTAVQDRLAEAGISAVVVIPMLDIGTVSCHINGDTFVLAAYLGYDVLYVTTTPERMTKKKELFAAYPKITVISPSP